MAQLLKNFGNPWSGSTEEERHVSSDDSEEENQKEYDIREARKEAHRRKIGLRLTKDQLSAAGFYGPRGSEKQEDLMEFIPRTFLMKECIKYVPDASKTSRDLTVGPPCYCGAVADQHWRQISDGTKQGSRDTSPSRSDMFQSQTLSPGRDPLVLTSKVTKELLLEQKKRRGSLKLKSRNSAIFPKLQSVRTVQHQETLNGTEMDTPTQPQTEPTPQRAVRLPPLIEAPSRNAPPTQGTSSGEVNTPRPGRPLVFNEEVKNFAVQGSKIGSPSGSPREKEELKWSSANFCELPTNAFGKVEFANDEARSKPAKYIRLSDSTRIEKVLELMVKMKMLDPHRPSLAISVIGGAKNFNLDGKKKEIFSHGLVKAAYATNAWILTSGCYMGVMKAVGEAVREGQSLQLSQLRVSNSLRCIGVVPWGYVRNREDLINEEGTGRWPATYHVDPVIRHGQPVSLDPHHTHFILVDDGYRNVLKPTVAEFRAKLERHIAAPVVREDGIDGGTGGLGIPVVVVLVEGGLDSLDFASESLKCRIPLVLCQGTGRAADILSYAHKHHIRAHDESGEYGPRFLPPRERQIIIEKLKAAYGKTSKGPKAAAEKKWESSLEKISKCCQEEDLITVFNINRDEDLDLAILSALLKGRGASRLDQLKLALKWNRPDVAAEKLFVDAAVWKWRELDGVMSEALSSNRVEFVRLLLQHGVVMKDYLTVTRLRKLYNSVGRGSFLKTLLQNVSGGSPQYYLHHVKELLERLLGRNMEEVYALDAEEAGKFDNKLRDTLSSSYDDAAFSPIGEARFEKPFKELFLWALLMHRHRLARFFWERGDSPIIGALVATKIYDSLGRIVGEQNPDLVKTYRAQKEEFERLSISILEYAYNADPEKALLIIEQRQPHWGDQSALETASSAIDKRFLATPCCQVSIDQIWKRGLSCSGFEIVLGLIFPFYVLFHLRFDQYVLGVDRRSLSWWQRLSTFYQAPMTKFCSFTIFYLAFLVLYTYVILFDFNTSWRMEEVALHVWVFSLAINCLRDLIMSYQNVPVEQRSLGNIPSLAWELSFWIKVEIFASLTHFFGLGLRWLPERHFDTTRLVFCLAVVLFYLKLLRVYMASSYLGPKLFVIRQMFKDVFMFLMILFVFMMAYAVGSQALLYPHRTFSWGVFKDIVYYPYWQMYGELSLDETIGGNLDGCSGNMTMNSKGQWCPRKYWPAALLLAAYLLMVNILLVNLLIAVFTHVFEEAQANSTEIWKFEMWTLTKEFDRKSTLPPPLALFESLYTFGKTVICGCCTKNKQDWTIPLTKKQRENLKIFEKECMNEYLRQQKEAKRKELSNRVGIIQEKVETLSKKGDEERERGKMWQTESMHRHFSSRSDLTATGLWGSTIDLALHKGVKKQDAETQCSMDPTQGSRRSSSVDFTRIRRNGNTDTESGNLRAEAAEKELRELQQRLEELEMKAGFLPEVEGL